ncbi:MAG: hypothetical protein ACRDNP_11725 [Gaiellaceae bacterium]
MSERELTPSERDAFLREHFGIDANGLIQERHFGGFVTGVKGREYRAHGHRNVRAISLRRPRTMAEILARIDELEAGATELWP